MKNILLSTLIMIVFFVSAISMYYSFGYTKNTDSTQCKNICLKKPILLSKILVRSWENLSSFKNFNILITRFDHLLGAIFDYRYELEPLIQSLRDALLLFQIQNSEKYPFDMSLCIFSPRAPPCFLLI